MSGLLEIALVSLIGLGTASSVMAGAAIGLYVPISKRLLACVLAFSAGALISALAIEFAWQGAEQLHHRGFSAGLAWAFVGGGFALGASFYYAASRFLEQRGGAVRYQTRFREFAETRKRADAAATIALLSRGDLLRHLPPEEIEAILPCVRTRHLEPGETIFNAGAPGDALYIVARGKVEVLGDAVPGEDAADPIAELGEGQSFGEMALLTGGPRTASVRAVTATDLLEIGKENFDQLLARDPRVAAAVERLSHERAVSNLSSGEANSAVWAKVARRSLDQISRADTNKLLAEVGRGSGLAIVLGNVLDTIPGCLVIGSKFNGLGSMSLPLIMGMFLGGFPEAAASAAMLRKAGYQPRGIFWLWSTVLVAGLVAAGAGKAFISGADSLMAVFSEALAGGAVLALVAHAMIPELIDEGGSLVVLPTVAGFLVALYLTLQEAFG